MDRFRSGLRFLAGLALATLVAGGSASAGELVGRISKVDTEAKKVVVTETGTAKSVDVAITSDTVLETAKGTKMLDLEKLRQRVEKAKKGVSVQVTLDNGIASRIKLAKKKDKG